MIFISFSIARDRCERIWFLSLISYYDRSESLIVKCLHHLIVHRLLVVHHLLLNGKEMCFQPAHWLAGACWINEVPLYWQWWGRRERGGGGEEKKGVFKLNYNMCVLVCVMCANGRCLLFILLFTLRIPPCCCSCRCMLNIYDNEIMTPMWTPYRLNSFAILHNNIYHTYICLRLYYLYVGIVQTRGHSKTFRHMIATINAVKVTDSSWHKIKCINTHISNWMVKLLTSITSFLLKICTNTLYWSNISGLRLMTKYAS